MPVHPTRIASILSVLAFVLAAVPAGAAESDPLQQLLIEKGFITEAELSEAQAEAAEEMAAAALAAEEAEAAEEAKKEASRVKVSAGSKGLIVESPDGAFLFGLGGRIQYDAGGFSGGQTPMGAGTELRRARILTYGTLWTDWNYKLEVNFDNNGNVSVTDGWIRYSGFRPFTITLGHQKVPFSQQSMSSSNWQVFQERALLDGFIDNNEEGRRRLGGVIQSYGRFWNAAAGVFGAGVSGPTNGNNEDWGTAGRLVFFPIAEAKRVITFGGSVYYREFESASSLQFQSRPEANLAAYRFANTGSTTPFPTLPSNLANATDALLYNIESSFVWNAFHAQAEFTGASVDRFGQSSLSFNGWYVQGGWFITGESRNFQTSSAQFKRITPNHRYGAWEIALRYSAIDLQTKDILGGEQQDVTVGLNWWVNQNIMFRFNYVRAMMDPTTTYMPMIPNPALPGTLVQAPGAGLDQSINAFMGRVQVVF